ncbi:MAG: hypothetical protein IJT30_02100, partial [Muribaculaceae bacterium]|nr:hypothetical protein [Muribaculaceae bacterium]
QAASLVEALAWSLTWSRVFDPSDLFEVIARLSHYRADTETHGLLQVSRKNWYIARKDLTLHKILSMELPVVYSLKPIEYQYQTGEKPVLVVCSDKHSYICKYMRSALASYKLASE